MYPENMALMIKLDRSYFLFFKSASIRSKNEPILHIITIYYEEVKLLDTFAHMYTSAQWFCNQIIIHNIIIIHYDNVQNTHISGEFQS